MAVAMNRWMLAGVLALYCNGAVKVALAQTAPTPPAAQSSEIPDEDTAKKAYARATPQPSLKKLNTVDRLLAIEEIRQLPLRYARCITQKDWDCVRALFTPDFYYEDGPNRVHGPEGFIDVMKRAGTYDRVVCTLHIHGHEVELLSPTTARGIAGADFTFYYPMGQSFPTTGKEVVAPGEQRNSPTYYYQTYEKIDGQWKIKTSDHISFDLRTDYASHTKVNDKAYVTPDGLRPYQK